MIVRQLQQCGDEGRVVKSKNWESARLLLKDDNMGFSFHITTIYANTETPLHYTNHLESVYCISGEGEVETVADGKVYPIRPGTIYILDQHDKHLLRAHTEITFACVFNPPLFGNEVHREDGSYATVGEPLGNPAPSQSADIEVVRSTN